MASKRNGLQSVRTLCVLFMSFPFQKPSAVVFAERSGRYMHDYMQSGGESLRLGSRRVTVRPGACARLDSVAIVAGSSPCAKPM